jgi:hypothetical protein
MIKSINLKTVTLLIARCFFGFVSIAFTTCQCKNYQQQKHPQFNTKSFHSFNNANLGIKFYSEVNTFAIYL